MAQILEVETTDVVIQETRRIKEELAKEHNFDVDRILQAARERQSLLHDRRILQPPTVQR